MKAIHAVYERGVFRPLEAVDLPEATEVVLEPRPTQLLPGMSSEARARVEAVFAQAIHPGDTAEQDEDGSLLSELAEHAEPMGRLTNAEIDRAVYGG